MTNGPMTPAPTPTCQRTCQHQHQDHANGYDGHAHTSPSADANQSNNKHTNNQHGYDGHVNTSSSTNAIKYNSERLNTSMNANRSNDEHCAMPLCRCHRVTGQPQYERQHVKQ